MKTIGKFKAPLVRIAPAMKGNEPLLGRNNQPKIRLTLGYSDSLAAINGHLATVKRDDDKVVSIAGHNPSDNTFTMDIEQQDAQWIARTHFGVNDFNTLVPLLVGGSMVRTITGDVILREKDEPFTDRSGKNRVVSSTYAEVPELTIQKLDSDPTMLAVINSVSANLSAQLGGMFGGSGTTTETEDFAPVNEAEFGLAPDNTGGKEAPKVAKKPAKAEK